MQTTSSSPSCSPGYHLFLDDGLLTKAVRHWWRSTGFRRLKFFGTVSHAHSIDRRLSSAMQVYPCTISSSSNKRRSYATTLHVLDSATYSASVELSSIDFCKVLTAYITAPSYAISNPVRLLLSGLSAVPQLESTYTFNCMSSSRANYNERCDIPFRYRTALLSAFMSSSSCRRRESPA